VITDYTWASLYRACILLCSCWSGCAAYNIYIYAHGREEKQKVVYIIQYY